VQTRYGLAVQSLSWLDADSLAMVAGHFLSPRAMDYTGSSRTYLFTVGSPSGYVALARADVADIPVSTWPQQGCAPTCPGRFGQVIGTRQLRIYHDDPNSTVSDVRLSTPVSSVAFDARRHLVAGTEGVLHGNGPTQGRLVVGQTHHGQVTFTAVPHSARYDQVFTWVDADHVTAVRQGRTGTSYELVDVRTGARRVLTSKPWYAFAVAQDALQRPVTVPGIAPPTPWNPRWVLLGGLVLVVALGVAVMLVFRRRRVGH
jgi:hypothetical protein